MLSDSRQFSIHAEVLGAPAPGAKRNQGNWPRAVSVAAQVLFWEANARFMSETLVPPSLSDDDDDVVIALETARVEEERGEPGEAARWVQRAAGAARKQGRPNRAGELSRVQAMLAEAASQFQRTEATEQVLDSDDDLTEHTIVDRPPTAAPVPPAAALDARTPTPVRSGTAETSSRPPQPPSTAPSRPSEAAPAASARPSAMPSSSHLATRVAVRKGTGGMLLVRPLRQEEQPSVGEQAALLVPLEPNVRIG